MRRTEQLKSVLANRIPDGLRLEIRSDPHGWTTFRYTRLSDGAWGQEVITHREIELAVVPVETLAQHVLSDVEQKFSNG